MTPKGIHLLLVLMLSSFGLMAQDSTLRKPACNGHFLNPSIHFGTLVGGQFNSGGFYYKSGFGTYITLDGAKKERLQIGLGAGIERLPREWLFPMYVQLISSLNDRTTGGFFILQTGYAFSILEAYNHYHGTEDHGGFMISPGWGYKIALEHNAQIYFSAQIKQQSLSIDFTNDTGARYNDQFTYNFLMLRAGIRF
jgi:hypothetical protein